MSWPWRTPKSTEDIYGVKCPHAWERWEHHDTTNVWGTDTRYPSHRLYTQRRVCSICGLTQFDSQKLP